MKFRNLLTGAVAVALLGVGAATNTAHATEGDSDADVGGSVAGIQLGAEVGSQVLSTLRNKDFATYNTARPYAVMGKNGGSRSFKVVNAHLGPVSAKVLTGTISGNRRGTPYATGRTTLTGLTIAGTNLTALDTTCTWDVDGARGATTVTDINGNANTPEPNTVRYIPGLGTLTLNEQFPDGKYVYDASLLPSSFPYRYTQVIYVYGAHLHLDAGSGADYGVADIIVGFTSCDPTKLPNLSGLTLGQNYAP